MTVYSDVRTSTTQDDPSELVKANQLAGAIRVARGVFEASAQGADTIEMFAVPNGARILSGKLCHDALGAGTTLAVGHAAYTDADGNAVVADPDEFKAAAASTAAQCVDVAATLALGANSEVSIDGAEADNEYVVTVTSTGTATGTIELTMLYVVD
jgi:hypothetical protein